MNSRWRCINIFLDCLIFQTISTKLYNSYTITLVKWSRKKERKDNNILIDVRGSLWFFAKKKKNWKVLEAIFTRHLHRNVRNAFDRIYAANEWTLPAVCNARLPDFHVRHIDFCSTSKMAVAVDAFRPHPHRTVIESSRWFQLEVTSGICNARIDEIGKLLVNYLNERARVLWKRLVSMDVFFFFLRNENASQWFFFFYIEFNRSIFRVASRILSDSIKFQGFYYEISTFFVRSRLIKEIEENFFFEQTKLQYANIARDRETWPCFSWWIYSLRRICARLLRK